MKPKASDILRILQNSLLWYKELLGYEINLICVVFLCESREKLRRRLVTVAGKCCFFGFQQEIDKITSALFSFSSFPCSLWNTRTMWPWIFETKTKQISPLHDFQEVTMKLQEFVVTTTSISPISICTGKQKEMSKTCYCMYRITS